MLNNKNKKSGIEINKKYKCKLEENEYEEDKEEVSGTKEEEYGIYENTG